MLNLVPFNIKVPCIWLSLEDNYITIVQLYALKNLNDHFFLQEVIENITLFIRRCLPRNIEYSLKFKHILDLKDKKRSTNQVHQNKI